MKAIVSLFILAVLAINVNAQDITSFKSSTENKAGKFKSTKLGTLELENGNVYEKYKITGCNVKGIEISHSAGIATVALEDWPKAKEFEISAYKNKILELRKKQSAQEKAAQAQETIENNKIPANATCLIFKVIGVEDGALLGSVNAVDWYKNSELSSNEKITKVLENLGSNGIVSYDKYLKEENSRTGNTSAKGKAIDKKNAMDSFTKEIEKQIVSGVIYISGIDTEGYTDDQQVIISGVRSGTYKYTAVNGATRTVPKFIAVKK